MHEDTNVQIVIVNMEEGPKVKNSKDTEDQTSNKNPDTFTPLDLFQVKVDGEFGRRIDLAVNRNFLALDVDNVFLEPFRHPKSKSETKPAYSFIGLGMLIDAAVLFAEYTKDPRVIARKNYIINETIKTQSSNGYIGFYQQEKDAAHLFREYCFHEDAYIVLGLAENFRYFGDHQSLDAAQKLADYIMTNWTSRPTDFSFTTLGICEAFNMLTQLTGQQRYWSFAVNEKLGKGRAILPASLRTWKQEIYPRQEICDVKTPRCHMYRIFERCMMQLRLNRADPDENLLFMPRKLISMMTRPERAGMVITGVCSLGEQWHENQDGNGPLAENCATVYELWFIDELMRLDGDLRYGDIMERAIHNRLFAAQDPDGRRIRHFTSFSGERTYSERDHWCCPNNFRRGMARLPIQVYYRMREGVAVNLYTTSKATLELDGGISLTIKQKTDYPTSGHVMIMLEPSRQVTFPVRLRIPRWCRKVKIAVNDEPADSEVFRTWKAGDQITIDMSMPWRFVKGREIQAGRAALMRGPVVYCLSRELNNLPADMNLREITIDPLSLGDPIEDYKVRPNGLMCRVKAWSPSRVLSEPPDLNLVMSEFPEPTGEEIYFRVPENSSVVDDELIE